MLWLLVAFYGFTITFPSGETNMDGIRRVENFEFSASRADFTFSEFKRNLSDEDSAQSDFFEPLLVFSLSKVTSDSRILFLIYGILFGFFYSRNLAYVVDKVKSANMKHVLMLLICFAFLNPFWNIGGFRYWFATHLFLYGLLPYLFENNKKRLVFLLFSPLVHFSYLFALFIFLGFKIIGNRLNFYFIYFLISIFIGNLEVSTFKTVFSAFSSGALLNKVEDYTDDQYVETVGMLKKLAVNWYVTFANKFMYWFVILIVLICFIKYRRQIQEKYATFFNFILFYLGTVFLASSVPSMIRFNTLGYTLVLSFFILYLNENILSTQIKKFLYWSNFGVAITIVVWIRISFETISFLFIFTNPILAPFFTDVNFSMLDLFK